MILFKIVSLTFLCAITLGCGRCKDYCWDEFQGNFDAISFQINDMEFFVGQDDFNVAIEIFKNATRRYYPRETTGSSLPKSLPTLICKRGADCFIIAIFPDVEYIGCLGKVSYAGSRRIYSVTHEFCSQEGKKQLLEILGRVILRYNAVLNKKK